MLQQTRVEAVIPYYERFLGRFPDIAALAAAPEQDLLAAWSGLGYYSRARKLQAAARRIVREGIPSTCEAIRELDGVGPYTAGALASIVFGLPHTAIDGNVLRVISRLTNDPAEISAPATKRRFDAVALTLLDPVRPGDFNQAMMELGATVCKPRLPLCDVCPVRTFCAAREAGTERALPVKRKPPKTREVRLALALFRNGSGIYLVQRDAGQSRLAGFWELPAKELFPGLRGRVAAEFSHQIVNDRFRVRVSDCRVPAELPAGRWVKPDEMDALPLATITRKALSAVRNAPAFPPDGFVSKIG